MITLEDSKKYSTKEEIVNSITHGVGAFLSLVGLVILIVFAAAKGSPRAIICYSVFGISMIILYLASTIYHGLTRPTVKKLLKKIDHAAIYILIAGTYTPFMLINLRGWKGWTVFIFIWILAVLGIISKFKYFARFHRLSITLYVVMGWLCIFFIKDMFHVLPVVSLVLLISGGLFYTLGMIFFGWHKLPYNHAVWHVFVLAGSLLHYFSVFFSMQGGIQ